MILFKDTVPPLLSDAEVHDPDRLTELHRLHLLDTPPEEAFDRLTRLATRCVDAPVAVISLVDETRQFFKSQSDPDKLLAGKRETPLRSWLCRYALGSAEPLVIPDATEHPVVRDSAAVTENGVRAYLGIPLVSRGVVLGTLCVFDVKPRDWSDEQVQVLRDLAAAAMTEIALRDSTRASARAEVKAEAGRARYQNLVDGLDAIVWEGDSDTLAFTFVSARAEQMLGYPVEQWYEDGFWLSIIHPEDRMWVPAFCQQETLEGRDHDFEYRVLASDGRVVWLRDIARIAREGTGEAVRGVMIDITSAKQQEEELRRSQNLLAAVTEGISDPMFIKDLRGRYQMINSAGARTLGREIQDVLGRTDEEMFPPEVGRRIWAADQRLIQSGAEHTYESVLELANGTRASMLNTKVPHRDESGVVIGLLGIARDITTLKQMEAELRDSEANFRQIADNVQEAFWSFAPDFSRCIYLSPAFETIWGRSVGDIYQNARSFLDNVHPEDLGTLLSAMEEVRHGTHSGVEYRLVRADGSVRWVCSRGAPVLDEKGTVCRVVGTTRDISERKAAQDALRESEMMLRQAQKMEAVGRLAGGIAHDFNNLLTVISANTEMILMDVEEPGPAREDLREIKHSADRAAALTRQLLAFSRRQTLQPRVLNLEHVVRGTDKLLRRLIGDDVELVTLLDPDIGPVHADPGQIEQVIVNLAVNARDAMPHGGRLTIWTEAVTADVDCGPQPYVALRVSDTGTGMDEHTLAQIFEPFFTTKPVGEGTGLGLATVYGIVSQSGGYVRAESIPAVGSTFTVLLPCVEGASGEMVAKPASRTNLSGEETVLLVEDEPAVRSIARRVLGRAGYTVLEAANGEEALRTADRHSGPIHLVLTDVVMPLMGGPELVRRLAMSRPDTSVLYMTGYAGRALTQDGASAGAMVLEKPFSPEVLLERVREATDRRAVEVGSA